MSYARSTCESCPPPLGWARTQSLQGQPGCDSLWPGQGWCPPYDSAHSLSWIRRFDFLVNSDLGDVFARTVALQARFHLVVAELPHWRDSLGFDWALVCRSEPRNCCHCQRSWPVSCCPRVSCAPRWPFARYGLLAFTARHHQRLSSAFVCKALSLERPQFC